MNIIAELNDESLESVAGGQDGGAAPQPQVTKVTTSTSSTTTYSGNVGGGYRGVVKGEAKGSYTESTQSTSVSTPCPPAWKGVPWR